MSALSELLNRAFAVKYPKASNRKIADEAGVSRGTIDNYRRGTHPAVPSDEVLTAFHKLLDIPMGELRAAAGLPVGEDLPYVPPREANMLSDRQRRAVDELIRSIVETRRTGHADPSDTADHPPAAAAGTPSAEEQKTFNVYIVDNSDPEIVRVHEVDAVDREAAVRTVDNGLRIANFRILPARRAGGADIAAKHGESTILAYLVHRGVGPPMEVLEAVAAVKSGDPWPESRGRPALKVASAPLGTISPIDIEDVAAHHGEKGVPDSPAPGEEPDEDGPEGGA